MYSNIGKKIKGLAKIIAFGGIAVCVLVGIVLWIYLLDSRYTQDYAFIGLLIAIVGSLLCWLSGFFVYGYGELIDQTQQINNKLSESNDNAEIGEKIAKLKEWRAKNLISEEEYRTKMESL